MTTAVFFLSVYRVRKDAAAAAVEPTHADIPYDKPLSTRVTTTEILSSPVGVNKSMRYVAPSFWLSLMKK